MCLIYFLRVRKEIEDTIGARTQLNYEDLTKLKFCSAMLKESLRLEPPIPSIERFTNCDFKVCGLDIPVGTSIWVNLI